MKYKKMKESQKRVRKFQVTITFAFIAIIILSMFVVILNSLKKSSTVLTDKVSSLVSVIDEQMELNIDNYLKTIEDTSTLVFSADPIYGDVVTYKYNPIANAYDKYDKIKIEEAISNKLIELSLMENYCDFAVVYSDGHTVGKISKSTNAIYGDSLYETLTPVVTRQRTNDGWFSSNSDEFVRLYYAKRLNDNAILVTSFYMTELGNIFARCQNMSSMTIRLIDSENTMIYSSDSDETGRELPREIENLIDEKNSAIVSNDDYIVSVGTCGDEWKIICSIPTSVVLAENMETRNYTLLVGIVAIIISIVAVALITKMISKPVNNIVEDLNIQLDTDLLTGIYNKVTYKDKCNELLRNNDKKNYAFWMIDIDDFKNVNDTMGHAIGDKVIVGVGQILKNVFSDTGIAGRIGGDEFSVMLTLPDRIQPETEEYQNFILFYYDRVKDKLEKLSQTLDYVVTLSIGTSCIYAEEYSQLYKSADKAVYHSKSYGKNQLTFYHQIKDEGSENVEKN